MQTAERSGFDALEGQAALLVRYARRVMDALRLINSTMVARIARFPVKSSDGQCVCKVPDFGQWQGAVGPYSMPEFWPDWCICQ